MIRVTQNTNYDTVRSSMATSKGRLENLQNQAATLRKVNKPSDDPIGSAKILETRTDKVNNDQFVSNAKLAEAFLDNTDHALSDLSEIVIRAKEIALSQASGASANEDTRLGIAEEVTQLFQQAVSIANTRIGDRFLFGGYKTDKAPIDEDGNYIGDNGQMMVEVAREVFVPMNVTGLEAFNTTPGTSADAERVAQLVRTEAGVPEGEIPPPERDPAGDVVKDAGPLNVNLFDELQKLRIALLTSDVDGIRNTLDNFDDLGSRVVAVRSKVGSRIMGLENTVNALERHNITNAFLTTNIEDADLAKVMSDMAKEETVFRTVLQTSHKLLQPTLMDFLR